jgi:class 3 adenylate cyclase
VVDDRPENIRLLDAVLSPRGYHVVPAGSGAEALELIPQSDPDLVLLDIVMPEMDGYAVCRAIREAPETAFLPVVMITASDGQERLKALEAGADDFVAKPFDRNELLARVASLARLKRYQDTILRQAEELETWNHELEARVRDGVAELERIGKLRRFLPPQLAEIVSSGDESALASHRREIVVVFCDLRQFTPFAESSEPEEVMAVLGEFHAVLGEEIFRYEGTLERFTGDGLMVFFNDPVPCEDPAARSVGMAVAMRDRVRALSERWSLRGHDLGFGIGIAQGYATLGRIGFEGRFDYAAIGSVTNMSARLCGEAGPWQILATQRVLSEAGEGVRSDLVGDLQLRGFSKPVRAFDVLGLDGAPATPGVRS